MAQRVVEHRTHVAVGDVRTDDRIGLEQACFDVFLRVQFVGPGELNVSRPHLLVVGDEVSAQRIVHLGTAPEGQSYRGSQRCNGEQHAAEVIESLHRIGCNYRKSPLPRATGIRASAFRSRGPCPILSGRHPGMPQPLRRHIP